MELPPWQEEVARWELRCQKVIIKSAKKKQSVIYADIAKTTYFIYIRVKNNKDYDNTDKNDH